jgi:phosphatidylserine decarboxylase
MIYLIVFVLVAGLLTMLSIKWELTRPISFSWAIIMGLCACLIVFLTGGGRTVLSPVVRVLLSGISAALLSMIAALVLFFRNPERTPPSQGGIIVSPADGIVKYVREIRNGELPFAFKKGKKILLSEFLGFGLIDEPCFQVGIGMSLLDVHVNRSPISGRLSLLKRMPGKFRSLKKPESLALNERVVGIIEGASFRMGFVLIASRLVRRICTDVQEGQAIRIGQRIGMIRFGSQVDLLIPRTKSVLITIGAGDRVRAGVSVIAKHELGG